MVPHSSTLARKSPRVEEPGGLLSMELHRVRHDCSDLAAASAARPHGTHTLGIFLPSKHFYYIVHRHSCSTTAPFLDVHLGHSKPICIFETAISLCSDKKRDSSTSEQLMQMSTRGRNKMLDSSSHWWTCLSLSFSTSPQKHLSMVFKHHCLSWSYWRLIVG